MGKRGPKPALIPGTDERRTEKVTIVVHKDEWAEFKQTCRRKKISLSEGVRELVAANLRDDA